MSPQDDVNRIQKLASGRATGQQNFALDSSFAGPNPEPLQVVWIAGNAA